MYMCMLCVFVCMHTRVYVCACMCVHVSVCVHTFVYVCYFVSACGCVTTYLFVYTPVDGVTVVCNPVEL